MPEFFRKSDQWCVLPTRYIGIVHNLDESKIGEENESTITIDVDE